MKFIFINASNNNLDDKYKNINKSIGKCRNTVWKPFSLQESLPKTELVGSNKDKMQYSGSKNISMSKTGYNLTKFQTEKATNDRFSYNSSKIISLFKDVSTSSKHEFTYMQESKHLNTDHREKDNIGIRYVTEASQEYVKYRGAKPRRIRKLKEVKYSAIQNAPKTTLSDRVKSNKWNAMCNHEKLDILKGEELKRKDEREIINRTIQKIEDKLSKHMKNSIYINTNNKKDNGDWLETKHMYVENLDSLKEYNDAIDIIIGTYNCILNQNTIREKSVHELLEKELILYKLTKDLFINDIIDEFGIK